MSDDDELKLVAEIERAIGKPSHVDMNEAFSARMRAAIEAGLESASIGIVTRVFGVRTSACRISPFSICRSASPRPC